MGLSLTFLQDADFIALTTLESIIAPTYLYQGDAEKVLQNGNWSRLVSGDDVKMKPVPYVQSGDIVELRIGGFNLNDLLATFNGQDDTLWPWGLRVNVYVIDRTMTKVAHGQANLTLIPADNRLPAK